MLDFLRFLRERTERYAHERAELLATAESSWAADWDNEAEDAAWRDL